MNTHKICEYIEMYKRDFEQIHDMEIYKWKAVKKFQDSFDIDAVDFSAMLDESLSLTNNLMSAGNYFPRKMIVRNAEESPEEVRNIFKKLFDQEVYYVDRIESFQRDIRAINHNNFGERGLKDYQDHRAIIVYLNLMYPDDNYFYKYRMFKDLIDRVDYDYELKIGATSNINHFYSLCNTICSYIKDDPDLIRMHQNRLSTDDYPDTNYNILTQDVIYAITNHLELGDVIESPRADVRLTCIQAKVRKKDITFSSSSTDYIQKAHRNKRIGDLGELLILKYERDVTDPSSVKHHSKDIGDGLGYDILSKDENGEDKYIEVKTTAGGLNTPFYVTANELERSKQDSDRFYLYRLYNFDDKKNQGDLHIIQGSLEEYCINPVQFEVPLQMQG